MLFIIANRSQGSWNILDLDTIGSVIASTFFLLGNPFAVLVKFYVIGLRIDFGFRLLVFIPWEIIAFQCPAELPARRRMT